MQTIKERARAAGYEAYRAARAGKTFEEVKMKYAKAPKEVKASVLKGFVQGQCDRAREAE